jgi:hypothetical protein
MPTDLESDDAGRASRAESRRAAWIRRLAALGFGCLFAFVVAEAAVRAIFGAPLPELRPLMKVRPNPYRGWEMVQEAHYTYDHPVSVNSLGLRGPEPGSKKPGEVRVLALGDSLVYGQGVGDEATLPAQLERILRARHGSITVVNGGMRHYNTAQEVGLLEELASRIDPDVVLLCWYRNDVQLVNIPAVYRRMRDRGTVTFDVGGRMEGWTLAKWRFRQLLRRSALLMELHDVYRICTAEPDDPAAIRIGLAMVEGQLRRLTQLAAERGFRVGVAIIPFPGILLAEDPDLSIEERLAAITRSLALPTIDLRPSLAGLTGNGPLPVVPYDGHYDETANGVMAEETARFLVASGLLPSDER